MPTKTSLNSGWNFANSYAQLPQLFHSALQPTPVSSPTLVIFNDSLAQGMGLNPQALRSGAGVEELAGNSIPPGASPLAQAYAGHQFGHFTMLGDGRALLLGEHVTPQGQRVDIQLKGSGITPYSRGGDGRAVLGPMLREYIISEAMHALGIATTRSLAVVTTGEDVHRETPLPGAILTRVAASHLRVGTFQYAAKWGTEGDLRALADYTLQRHFPWALEDTNPYFCLLREVVLRQAQLIAQWQLVGFVHGVMNTDNMALSGETIDYGPCAFMDTYDPDTVFSSIDRWGRYAYGQQPQIAAWNLARFAETLLPLLHANSDEAVALAQQAVSEFSALHHAHWLMGMQRKLGLTTDEPEDEAHISDLLTLMHRHGADYTNTFRALTLNELEGMALFDTQEFSAWHRWWQVRLARQGDEAAWNQLMHKNNPGVIPRNHRVEEALAAAEMGDYGVLEKLLDVLSRPYAHAPEQEEYAQVPAPSDCPYRTFCGT